MQLRGVRPFFSEKYDITKHTKYKYLSDFDKKNAFDMEKHLRRRPAIVKPDEVFDYYEVDEADLQEKNGRTPRSCKIHFPPSMTAISSSLISCLPNF